MIMDNASESLKSTGDSDAGETRELGDAAVGKYKNPEGV